MKTLIIWTVLFLALIGTIVFLLSQGTDIKNPFKKEAVDTVATTTVPLSFDQATVYTCAGSQVVAAAFKTGDTTVLEVSLPNSNPLIMTQTDTASGARYTHESGLAFWEKGGVAIVEKDNEIIFSDCKVGQTMLEIEVATTSMNNFSGTSWQWNMTNSADGTILSKPNTPNDFILKFQAEGKFSVSTDCNNAGGSYSTDNKGMVTFSEIVMTLMACEGETKEADFLSNLGQVQSFGFAQTEADLELRLRDGTTYMSFSKIK